MLFVLNKSIMDVLDKRLYINSDQLQHLIDAIENLALSRKCGYHLIYAELDTLKFLKNCQLLNSKSRGIYSYLYNRYTETKLFSNIFNTSIELFPNEAILEINLNGEHKKIKASLEYFTNISLINPTRLLSENLVDTKLYEKIADIFLYTTKTKGIKVKFKPQGGGGHTTWIEYQNIVDSMDELCICIADNDHKYENCSNGDTLKRLLEIDEGKRNFFTELYPLNYHEIENLIPTSILKTVCKDNPDWQRGIDFLERLENNRLLDCRRYFDMKKGIKWKKIKNNNLAYEKYWFEIVKGLGIISGSQYDDEYMIVNGLGGDILKRVLTNYLNDITLNELYKSLPAYLLQDWIKIGKLISSWCCAKSPIITV